MIHPSCPKRLDFAAVCRSYHDVANSIIKKTDKLFFKIPTLHENKVDAFKTYFAKYLNRATCLASLTFGLDNYHQKTPKILTRLAEKLSSATKLVDLTFDLIERSNNVEVQASNDSKKISTGLETLTLIPITLETALAAVTEEQEMAVHVAVLEGLAAAPELAALEERLMEETPPSTLAEPTKDLTHALKSHIGKLIYLRSLTINIEIDGINVQKLLEALSEFEKTTNLNLELKIKSANARHAVQIAKALQPLTNLKNLTIDTKESSIGIFAMVYLAKALPSLTNLRSLTINIDDYLMAATAPEIIIGYIVKELQPLTNLRLIIAIKGSDLTTRQYVLIPKG